MVQGAQLKQIGRRIRGGRGGERGESVNDMYTQTGRAGRKEGKTPRKTKRERERKRGGRGNRRRKKSRRRRNFRLKCLGSSDDSQSSCLLASRFPLPSTPPAVCVRTSFLSLSLSASSPLSPPPLSPHPRLRLCVSLFCSSRTHRCGTSIVLKLFHLLAPPHRARPVFVTRRS